MPLPELYPLAPPCLQSAHYPAPFCACPHALPAYGTTQESPAHGPAANPDTFDPGLASIGPKARSTRRRCASPLRRSKVACRVGTSSLEEASGVARRIIRELSIAEALQ